MVLLCDCGIGDLETVGALDDAERNGLAVQAGRLRGWEFNRNTREWKRIPDPIAWVK